MTSYLLFFSGMALGIYIDQTYSVPKIKTFIDKLSKEVKKYEKDK
jgi:hypothetical protein